MTTNTRIVKNPNGGGVSYSPIISTKTADYTITDTDGIDTIVASGSGTDITLPNPVNNAGRTITIQRNDTTNIITVKRFSSGSFLWLDYLIDYDLQMNDKDILVFKSNGSSWVILSYNGLGTNNYLINGSMEFWQRNTTFGIPPTNVFVQTTDRWKSKQPAGGALNGTISKNTTDYPIGFKSSCNIIGSTQGAATEVYQFIENINCNDLAGKVVTSSAYLKTYDAGFTSMYFAIHTSTTSPDTTVMANYSSVATMAGTVSTTWTKKACSGQIPSNVANVAVGVFSPTFLANGGVTGVMLNIGCLPAPFTRAGKTYSAELQACQRYFEILDSVRCLILIRSTTIGVLNIPYKVEKRAIPTFTNPGRLLGLEAGGYCEAITGSTACYSKTSLGHPFPGAYVTTPTTQYFDNYGLIYVEAEF